MKQILTLIIILFHSLLATGQYRMLYDPAFSGDGVANIPFKLSTNEQGLFLQSDGKIVGLCENEIAWNNKQFRMFRLNPDGSIDNSYANNGIFNGETNFSSTLRPVGLMLPGDEMIVTGSGKNVPFYNALTIHKFLTDGSLDSTFGLNGALNLTKEYHSFYPIDVAQYQDSSLLVLYGANYEDNDTSYTTALISKVSLDGKLDTTFADNGFYYLFDPLFVTGHRLALGVDGSVYVLLRGYINVQREYVIKLNPDFSRDQNFLFTQDDLEYELSSLLIDDDGKLVVGGEKNVSGFGLWRLMPDGTKDQSFGKNGFMSQNMHVNTGGLQLLMEQPDGKILCSFGHGAMAARVTPGGKMDYSFDLDGVAVAVYVDGDFANYPYYASGALFQPDGKVVFMVENQAEFLRVVRIVAGY